MMQKHNALPTEAREKGDAVVFLILRKGLKISHDEIGKSEERQRNGEDEEAMGFICLKSEGDGGNHVGKMNGEEKFSRAAIDEAERREGVCKDDGEGEEKKEESGKWEGVIGEEDVRG